MEHGNPRQYFEVGASALAAIRGALSATSTPVAEIRTVLDYGCGYGRVLRWLKAQFAEAYILGIDIDERAIRSAGKLIGVSTQQASAETTAPIGSQFDLIWMGSVLTHVPASAAHRILSYLRDCLSESGVLVFTTHGPYVKDRIRNREKLYGLAEEQIHSLLRGYDEEGYGYGDYPGQASYGISAVRPDTMRELAGDAHLNVEFYREKYWANHQDVFAARAIRSRERSVSISR